MLRYIIVGFFVAGIVWVNPDAHARTELIARTGDPAPGRTDVFTSLEIPGLNETGQLAFFAQTTQGVALYSTPGGELTLQYADGDELTGVPGSSGLILDWRSHQGQPLIDVNGQLILQVELSGADGLPDQAEALMQGVAGDWRLLAYEGQPAPGLADGAVLAGFFNPRIATDSGSVAFSSRLAGPGYDIYDAGVWWIHDGSAQPIASPGDPAPSVPGRQLARTDLSAVGNGQVAYVGRLNDSSTDGLWIYNGSTHVLAALEDAPTGLLPGVDFQSIGDIVMNRNGQVAFGVGLRNDGSTTIDNALWYVDSITGDRQVVARKGDAAPGTSGMTYSRVHDWDLLINNAGAVAYGAYFEGDGSQWGLWVGSPGDSHLVIAEGDAVPGIDPIPGADSFGYAAGLADGNQVLFYYASASSSYTRREGYFISDGVEIVKVVTTGEMHSGKTIRSVNIGGDYAHDSPIFNNFGQVAYRVTFDDNSQSIELYTPELHWRGTAGDGRWDSSTNWTLSLDPAHVHDVFIDGQAGYVLGPSQDTAVQSLTIGDGVQNQGLMLTQQVRLTALEGLAIRDHAVAWFDAGVLDLNGGELQIEGTFAFTGGRLENVGAIHGGLFQSGGTLAAGASVGQTQVLGDYAMGEHATLEVELDAAGHDQYVITGNTLLDGTLAEAGDSFVFLTADTVTGEFDEVNLPALDDGLGLALTYEADSVALFVFMYGDVNSDGAIDVLDVRPFNALVAGDVYIPAGDINGDGAIDILDIDPFVTLVAGGDVSAVPEPGSVWALVLAWLGLPGRGRGRLRR